MKVVRLLFAFLFVTSAALFAADPEKKHKAVKNTEDFYAAVDANELDKAEKLTVPKRYPKEKLQKMKDLLRLDQAKVHEAYIGKEQSAIVTDEIAPRDEGKARKGRWGVSLRLVDRAWLIRDFDFLPDDKAVKKYLEGFRKVEPNAEKAKLGELRKSPGEVVRAFYLASNAGKYSEAEEMLNSEAKQAVSGFVGQMSGGFKGICDKNTKNGNILGVDIVSEEVRGEGATVVVSIRFKDGTTKQNSKNQLVLQNEKWLLTIGN